MTAIPDYVKKILHMLTEAGYEAYIVGGAVRDLLLKLPPGDFDITTNATPEEISAVCRASNIKTIDNLGQNFGCVVAVIDGVPAEITTFRGESYGTDAHKPEKVWFSKSLREDLSRRDFTVNAMAMDINGRIYDYHNGMEDLQNHILRTVGDAGKRYSEDALRMLRACRFVAQLGFDYVQFCALSATPGSVTARTPCVCCAPAVLLPSLALTICRKMACCRPSAKKIRLTICRATSVFPPETAPVYRLNACVPNLTNCLRANMQAKA